jgi:hypothetical protein
MKYSGSVPPPTERIEGSASVPHCLALPRFAGSAPPRSIWVKSFTSCTSLRKSLSGSPSYVDHADIFHCARLRVRQRPDHIPAFCTSAGRGPPATGKAALSASWPRIAGLRAATAARRLGVWGRLSFSPLPISGVLSLIEDADDPLAARVEVDVPHLDGLSVAAAVAIEGLDQLGL